MFGLHYVKRILECSLNGRYNKEYFSWPDAVDDNNSINFKDLLNMVQLTVANGDFDFWYLDIPPKWWIKLYLCANKTKSYLKKGFCKCATSICIIQNNKTDKVILYNNFLETVNEDVV